MDEGGQLAAEYSSKQSKETQLAHKADRKLSNQAVHAEQAWAGGRSEDKWGNRHRTAKKKEAHKTAHPNATRPKNRERQHQGGGGGEKQRQARKKEGRRNREQNTKPKKKRRGTGEAKGRPGPQKQGHPEQRGERQKKGWDAETLSSRGGDRNDGKEPKPRVEKRSGIKRGPVGLRAKRTCRSGRPSLAGLGTGGV